MGYMAPATKVYIIPRPVKAPAFKPIQVPVKPEPVKVPA